MFRFFSNYAHDLSQPIPAATPSSSLSTVEQYMVSKAELVARSVENDMKRLDVETACQEAANFLLNSVCDL